MIKAQSFLKTATMVAAIAFTVATISCKKINAAIRWITNEPEKTEQITKVSNDTITQIADIDNTNVATYNPDQQKNNLEGGQDTNFTNALQSVINKHQNSNEDYVKNTTKRFNELLTKKIIDYDHVKDNLLNGIQICLTPNMVESAKNAEIAFYIDVINVLNNGDFEKAGHKIVLPTEITENHFFLLATNPQYKENYNRAKELFLADAISTCAKIAADRELTAQEKDAYLISVYYSWLGSPQTWTTEAKRNFIGLYTGDVLVWKNATDEQVNKKFDELMTLAKKKMERSDLTKTPMPVYVSEQDKQLTASDLM